MDMQKTGDFIHAARKKLNMSQRALGEYLRVTDKAVSKWERGESIPDILGLKKIADLFGVSVDFILTGGSQVLHYRGKFTVAQIHEGILSLKQMGELLGKDNILYRHAIEGINEKMNTNIEDAFTDQSILECFMAEAIIQNLTAGKYIDPTDVKNGFQHDHFREIVLQFCHRYGIK